MSSELKTALTRRTLIRPSISPTTKVAQVIALLVVGLALFSPSVLTDITDTVLARSGMLTGLRWGISMLAVFVLSYRRLHWWEPLALLLAIMGLLGNYTQNIGTVQELVLSDFELRAALGVFVVRLLFRPTAAEDRVALQEARAEIEQLRTRLSKCEAAKEKHV